MGEPSDLVIMNRCPRHMPKGWEPPVPAFTGDMDEARQRVVVVYIGIQNPASQSLAEFDQILDKAHIPHLDLATFIDRAGHKNLVAVAYFATSQEHVQWENDSGFATWWDSDKHLDADYGLWMERYAFEPGQFETLFSTPDSPEGLARSLPGIKGPIREHAYSGGAEDRIPNCKDPSVAQATIEKPTREVAKTKGKRIVVQGPPNMCLIRSGQDLSSVSGSELETYDHKIRPALEAGLSFLSKNESTGCFDSRYMQHCDLQGNLTEKTFGMVLFRCLTDLTQWAHAHPTHLAIFNAFQDMAIEREGQFELRLWHEVAVMSEGDVYTEYVNCDPSTGLLPFAHAL